MILLIYFAINSLFVIWGYLPKNRKGMSFDMALAMLMAGLPMWLLFLVADAIREVGAWVDSKTGYDPDHKD
jgi:hypothetical protein